MRDYIHLLWISASVAIGVKYKNHTGLLSAICPRGEKMRSYGLLEGQVRIRVQSMWQTSPPSPLLSHQYFYMQQHCNRWRLSVDHFSLHILPSVQWMRMWEYTVLQLKWQYLDPHEDELGWGKQSSTSYDLWWLILDSARQKYWWCLCWLEYLKKSSWTTLQWSPSNEVIVGNTAVCPIY